MESRSREQILNLESSLEEKNIRNNRMKIELLEASSVQTALREELKKVKDLYRIEMDKVKASLGKILSFLIHLKIIPWFFFYNENLFKPHPQEFDSLQSKKHGLRFEWERRGSDKV